MKNVLSISLFCLVTLAFVSSCGSAKSQNKTKDIANKSSIISQDDNTIVLSSNEDAESLCNRLHELKKIPYRDDQIVDDFIYNGLVNKGKDVIPCLVSKITDTTSMNDPGPGPVVQVYKVGDAAVFMLLRITKEEWQPKTMLSPKYAKLWETEGIYSYFAYVEKIENREKIQMWWKDWMKKNLNK